jgi:hypothetical protein
LGVTAFDLTVLPDNDGFNAAEKSPRFLA